MRVSSRLGQVEGLLAKYLQQGGQATRGRTGSLLGLQGSSVQASKLVLDPSTTLSSPALASYLAICKQHKDYAAVLPALRAWESKNAVPVPTEEAASALALGLDSQDPHLCAGIIAHTYGTDGHQRARMRAAASSLGLGVVGLMVLLKACGWAILLYAPPAAAQHTTGVLLGLGAYVAICSWVAALHLLNRQTTGSVQWRPGTGLLSRWARQDERLAWERAGAVFPKDTLSPLLAARGLQLARQQLGMESGSEQ